MKKYFEELSDSRQKGKIKYNLAEVVVMALIAVTAGAEHWNEIALYCKSKEEMLKTEFDLELENGTLAVDNLRLYSHIQNGLLYDPDNRPLEQRDNLRKMNEILAGPQQEP